MSEYTHRVTLACPIAFVPICNQLSGARGLSYADANYFGDANFVDADGNEYCVRSTACTSEFLAAATSGADPERPAWDEETQLLDMDMAAEANNLLMVADAPAQPDCICVVVGADPKAAVAALGLTLIPSDEEV